MDAKKAKTISDTYNSTPTINYKYEYKQKLARYFMKKRIDKTIREKASSGLYEAEFLLFNDTIGSCEFWFKPNNKIISEVRSYYENKGYITRYTVNKLYIYWD